MGVKDWLQQAARTLRLAVKPGREELWLSIKISLLGIGAVGLIGFVIKLLSYAVGGATSGTTATA
jgi:protein translocase SEC61 complex gamma subunit